MALLEGMRSDAVILADVGVGDTVITDDKDKSPMNYNIYLNLEVLLNQREFLDEILMKLEEVKTAIEAI